MSEHIIKSVLISNSLADKVKVLMNLALLYFYKDEEDLSKYDDLIEDFENTLTELEEILEQFRKVRKNKEQ